jgi:hypothetical protein
MTTSRELPYWANEYVNHIRQHRPEMYAELEESGELEPLALSIQSSAQAYYNQLFAHNKRNGENDTTADFYAKGDVMREYILLPTEQDVPELYENMDGMEEESEDAFEPGHLEFLNFLNEMTYAPGAGAFRSVKKPSSNS